MNDYEYELIGESIWDTYRNMAYLLSEVSLEWMAKTAERGHTARKTQRMARAAAPSIGPRDESPKRVRPKGGEALRRIRARLTPGEAETFQHRILGRKEARRDAPHPGPDPYETKPMGTGGARTTKWKAHPRVSPESKQAKRAQTDPSPLAQRKVGNGNGNGK